MHGPDGTDYRNKHIYGEIIKPEKIVLNHVTAPKFQMVVLFEPQGEKTLITITSTFESARQLQEVVKVFKADEGMKQNIDRLELYIAQAPENKQVPLIIERVFNAPVSKIWRAITDKNEMKKWYFDLPEFKAETGFEFQFWGGDDIKQYLHLCKVIEVINEQKLSYSWKYDNYNGYSVVTFELFAEGNNTRLKLTHSGIESFPKNDTAFTKQSFENGWTHILDESLKAYTEAPHA